MRAAKEAAVMGVYAIRCIDGRAYVGGSAKIRDRWWQHRGRLRYSTHPNRLLQQAWREHGESAFTFEVLEVVQDRGCLFDAEQKWIDRLSKSGGLFNLSPTAGSQKGFRHSDEVKRRVSQTVIERCKDPAYRARLSASAKGLHQGSKHPLAKLTETDVLKIKTLCAEGVLHRDIAKQFGVAKSNISMINMGKTWSHVELPATSRLSKAALAKGKNDE